ncbi:N-acetyltransferase [Actinorhabdospora filicis]|uniref:N-acetyltransferase n=1 Tax=Actinorhabdospora filicis TaxID=1785913 RepID=A0A9W6W7N5_9ACTN|nr:N-acetyltransferase [Actinorhabdospora filicis]
MIDIWPLPGLRIRTGSLELRLPTDAEAAELAELAAAGVHEPGVRRFLTPWLDGGPLEILRGHWQSLGEWRPEAWSLSLAVFDDGVPVGSQTVRARDFGLVREIWGSSWLGKDFHGRGIGTRMRAASLYLAFEGLGAIAANSAAFADNHASLAVSRKLGYRPAGLTRDAADGRVWVSQTMRLERADWACPVPVEIEGLAPCLPHFGL